MKKTNLKKKGKKVLPRPLKVAATHSLKDLGFSVRQIAEIMGIDAKTVLRYQDEKLEPEFQRFADTIKKIYLEQDFELVQLAVKYIKEKIPKARFYELVGLLKTIRELNLPRIPGMAQQINLQGEKIQFEIVANTDEKDTTTSAPKTE